MFSIMNHYFNGSFVEFFCILSFRIKFNVIHSGQIYCATNGTDFGCNSNVGNTCIAYLKTALAE